MKLDDSIVCNMTDVVTKGARGGSADSVAVEDLIRGLVLPMYSLERVMPILFRADWRMENDAEHSWSVAMLSCALAPEIDHSLDVGLIAQYATVHDLVEVFAGDTSIFADEEHRISKKDREKVALERIREVYGHFPWIGETIERYEQKSDGESKFVYAVDKLIAIMYDYIDEGRYYHKNKITKVDFDRFFNSHRKKAHAHEGVGQIYDRVRDLLDEHPEYFYQPSKKRR